MQISRDSRKYCPPTFSSGIDAHTRTHAHSDAHRPVFFFLSYSMFFLFFHFCRSLAVTLPLFLKTRFYSPALLAAFLSTSLSLPRSPSLPLTPNLLLGPPGVSLAVSFSRRPASDSHEPILVKPRVSKFETQCYCLGLSVGGAFTPSRGRSCTVYFPPCTVHSCVHACIRAFMHTQSACL